uniref:sorting nexin-21 isoform X1 n=1 Tax=Doryrhamphus excisus TaxID=161450 RepID=UPI0025ADB641|nr:sorting nexin-21 isoform X1 [Doryrhamphus excisus]XP_057908097.1 sorting nexin-21 isoform X1 [Doryrhamphus excisus]
MASRLLDRLKRSLFKEGQEAGPEQEAAGGDAAKGWSEDCWEAELEEEEECVTERLGGTLSFNSRGGAEGEGSGLDSDSDFLGESVEEGLSSTDASPVGPATSSLLTRQLHDSWRSLHGLGDGSPTPKMQRQADTLSFEVTDASVVQNDSSNSTPSTSSGLEEATRPRPSSPADTLISGTYTPPCAVNTEARWSVSSSHERSCAGTSRPRPSPSGAAPLNSTCLTCAPSLAWRGLPACVSSSTCPTCRLHSCSSGDASLPQEVVLFARRCHHILVGRYQDALGPLLNAKRLQDKLGGAVYCPSDRLAPPPGSSHWLFTLVGLSCCFQEVDQLEEARDHVAHALLVLTPPEEKPLPPQMHLDRPHPLLLPLLRAAVRLCWQTGRDKRRWEELLCGVEEQWAGLEDQPTLKEFLVKCNLHESQEQG